MMENENLSRLHRLSISASGYTDLSFISKFVDLHYLNIYNINDEMTDDLTFLKHLTKLQELDIHSYSEPVVGCYLKYIRPPYLEKLTVSARLGDDCLALISNMKELQYLTFSDCYITELDVMQLTRLSKLKRLDLWQTEMPEELAYELENRGGFEVWDDARRERLRYCRGASCKKCEREINRELAKNNAFLKTVMDVFQE